MRPFPTQFNATPPARQSLSLAGTLWTYESHPEHISSVTFWIEAAISIYFLVNYSPGFLGGALKDG